MSLILNHNLGIKAINSVFEFSVDPMKKNEMSDINFVTHAHKDHVNINSKNRDLNYILTKETYEIAKYYFGDFNSTIIDYSSKIKFDDFNFSFQNSGHVLGSYSLKVDYSGLSTLITGDINFNDTLINSSIKPLDVDFLVIESTYGKEESKFPKRDVVESEFIRWIEYCAHNNILPVIVAYPFGKTQDMISVINKHMNVNIGLLDKSYDITNIYVNFGIKLKNYINAKNNLKSVDILILPPSILSNELMYAIQYESKRKIDVCNVSGQDFFNTKTFKFSNHSDCYDLLDFIEECSPKKVYTYHGHKNNLANIIKKKLGILAEPLVSSKIY